MWVATSDPHTDNGLGPDARRNPLPAPRDLGAFKGTKPPSDPGYDEADVGDKPDWIQELPRLSKEQKEAIRTLYVSQLESLGAVDDLVATLVKQLRHNRELRNTIFVFTSDNGFIRGQHRIDSGKSLIYEPSLQVPLIVAGPGFESGERMSQPVANVDMAPTLLRAAGATPTLPQDGVPLQPITDASKTRPPILLEIYGRKDGNTFGVRTSRFVYAEHSSGFQELYDLRNDPFELANVAGNPKYRNAQQDLAETLNKLRGCAGATCHLRSG